MSAKRVSLFMNSYGRALSLSNAPKFITSFTYQTMNKYGTSEKAGVVSHLSDILWSNIKQKQYQECVDLISVRTGSELLHSDPTIVEAAIVSHGTMQNIDFAFAFLEKHRLYLEHHYESPISHQKSTTKSKLDPQILHALIHACCASGSIKASELIIYHWLKLQVEKPTSTSDAQQQSLKQLFELFTKWSQTPPPSIMNTSANSKFDLSKLSEVPNQFESLSKWDWSDISDTAIQLETWATLIRAYSFRNAQSKCKMLMDLLGNQINISSVPDMSDESDGKNMVSSNLKVLNILMDNPVRIYMQKNAYSKSALVSIIYHKTLQAFCETYRSNAALQLLDEMKHRNISLHLPAISYMLRSYQVGSVVLLNKDLTDDLIRRRRSLLELNPLFKSSIQRVLNLLASDKICDEDRDAIEVLLSKISRDYHFTVNVLGLTDLAMEFKMFLKSVRQQNNAKFESKLVEN